MKTTSPQATVQSHFTLMMHPAPIDIPPFYLRTKWTHNMFVQNLSSRSEGNSVPSSPPLNRQPQKPCEVAAMVVTGRQTFDHRSLMCLLQPSPRVTPVLCVNTGLRWYAGL